MTNGGEPAQPEQTHATRFSPQLGGWFMLLVIVGALVTVRHWLGSVSAPVAGVQQVQYAIDINQATEADLLNLPEIGPTLAKKILRHRDEVGPFEQVEDLTGVPGIGPLKLKQLAPFLTFPLATVPTGELAPQANLPPESEVGERVGDGPADGDSVGEALHDPAFTAANRE
jgi:competence ComEA-like helix-hairpin-helix protein